MSKLVKLILGICCVFILLGCQSEKENSEVNNTPSQEQEQNDDISTSISSNSKYIEGWNSQKERLDGCSFTFLTPSNMLDYQQYSSCNHFRFVLKENQLEVRVLFNSVTNFDGPNVELEDINNETRDLRDFNLSSIFSNDGSVQYNDDYKNVSVAGYEALLDKGTATDGSGEIFNYAIYQLYLGEEKEGICELLVGSTNVDSDSLAEIGEELIATIQPEE